MARKPLDQIEFCKGTTIGKIKELMAYKDTDGLAQKIHDRFMERFLTPLKSVANPHGFFTMAICCLFIEAIQRYRRGFKDETKGSKEDLYGSFFGDFPQFAINRTQGRTLWHSLRSGVLHLGETKGWLIHRKGKKIVDFETKTINATKFRDTLEECLDDYCATLKKRRWDSSEWEKVKNRLNGFFEYSDLNYDSE
jgi:hypothetical protein